MIKLVSRAVNQFYKEKDHRMFKTLCGKPLNLCEELKIYIESRGFILSERNDLPDFPSRSWNIHFDVYKQGKFEVCYSTSLQISKVAPLFNIGHCYSVENKDKNKIEPDLGDCSNKPYTKKQLELHERISAALKKDGYIELSDEDMYEIVEKFRKPEGIKGDNVSVNNLLFMDIYNILGDED